MARNITVIPASGRSRSARRSLPETKKIRVGAYCRVSTEQEDQKNSFDNQVSYYTRYIEEKPEYQLVDIYADEVLAGPTRKSEKGSIG